MALRNLAAKLRLVPAAASPAPRFRPSSHYSHSLQTGEATGAVKGGGGDLCRMCRRKLDEQLEHEKAMATIENLPRNCLLTAVATITGLTTYTAYGFGAFDKEKRKKYAAYRS